MSASRVLLIDDDEEGRTDLRMHLEDFGHEVIAPDRTYESVDDLVSFAVAEDADVTLCDHRLQPGGLAPFFGAEAVSTLVQSMHVAVLMTGYFDIDFDTSIRAYRGHIPALLRRDELQEPDSLDQVMAAVRLEMGGVIPPERRLWQTVVRVGDVSDEGHAAVLDVFIPGWRPAQAVRMPAAMLPGGLRARLNDLRGRFLQVEVNVGATVPEEVYFGRVSGLVEPAEWPVERVGGGVDLPLRSDPPTGLFEDRR
jgi:CheY-like chemotaxis protein